MDNAVSVLSHHVCRLGEGPSYDPAGGRLFWFDIVNGDMLEHDMSASTTAVHKLGRMASAVAVIDDARQLIATETGLFVRETATGRMTLHTPIEANDASTRSNDARVHPCGAFWVSTMGKKAEPGAGSIYWFFKGELRRLFSSISIPNSIAFSADGTVVNLTQPTSANLKARAGHTQLKFGDAQTNAVMLQVQPPVGNELLLVVASEKPLFDQALPDQESNRAFLSDLRQAVLSGDAGRITATAVPVTTTE